MVSLTAGSLLNAVGIAVSAPAPHYATSIDVTFRCQFIFDFDKVGSWMDCASAHCLHSVLCFHNPVPRDLSSSTRAEIRAQQILYTVPWALGFPRKAAVRYP